MQKVKYIELGDNLSSSQTNEDLFSKRSDEMNEYLEKNDILNNSKLLYSDLNRQIYRVDEFEVAENTIKTLLYVRYLEQIPQIDQIISRRSVKLSAVSSKYLAKFIKYDIVQNNNLPLVVQHIESSRMKEPYSDIYKNSIPIDQILRVLKRLIKIVTNLHQQGINYLDISESNFEIDIQTYKPTMVAVPLCIRGDISQSEACYRDFEELGLMMLKLVNSSNIIYANDLSYEQMRLKACVLQICQEFTDCRHIANGISEFVVKQLNRLTCIKQICKSISQSVEDISVQQFIPQRKSQDEFHRQIETLEIDILGQIPEQYRRNQSFAPKTCKERWMYKILCLLLSLFFLFGVLFLWNSRSSPFLCIRNGDELNCKVKTEKEGILFETMKIEYGIRSLTIDFSNHQLKAEKIIEILSKIERNQINNFNIDAQYNEINKEGLKLLLQFLKENGKAFYIALTIYNTPVEKEYIDAYSLDIKSAYESVNDLFADYFTLVNSTHSFQLHSEMISYFNARTYLDKVDHQSEYGMNYVYLYDMNLKDNEVSLIMDEIFSQRHHFQTISINLAYNQIDGTSIVKIMEQYVHKYNNYTSLNIKINSNPITKDLYTQFINHIKQTTSLKSVVIDIDMNPFQTEEEFTDITFFQKAAGSQISSYYINIIDAKTKNIYLISKNLAQNFISFDIDFKVHDLLQQNQFANDFPQGEDYCFPIVSQSVLDSKVILEMVEIKTSLQRVQLDTLAICDMQNAQKGMALNSLRISSDDSFVENTIKIVDPLNPHYFKISATYSDSSYHDKSQFNFLDQLTHQKFKQMIVASSFISDIGVNNIVKTGLDNDKLQELELSAEFPVIQSYSISQLLSLLTSHPTLQQADLTLHSRGNKFSSIELPIVTSQQAVLDLLAEQLKKTESLKYLNLTDSKSPFQSFESVFTSFEKSPSLRNLTIHFNNQNFSSSDIRTFYYLKRRLQDSQKYIRMSPSLIFQDLSIYYLESFYERILFHLRESESRVFLSSSDDQPLNGQMVNDFINEIDNARAKEVFIQIFNDFSSSDYSNISKKISTNTHIKEFIFRNNPNNLLKADQISSIFDGFASNTSLEYLELQINFETANIPSQQQQIQKSMKKLVNGMKNLTKIELKCSKCFFNMLGLYEVMYDAYLLSNLQSGRIEDANIKLDEFHLKRIAFMSVASDKKQLFPFSQEEQQNKFYTECISQFTSYNKEDLSLTYVNSNLDDNLMKFVKKYITRKGGLLQNFTLKFSGNTITDQGVEEITVEIEKLTKLEKVSFDFESNKLETSGCMKLVNSLVSSQKTLKSIGFSVQNNKIDKQVCFENLLTLVQKADNLEEILVSLPLAGSQFIQQMVQSLLDKKYIKTIYVDIQEYPLILHEAKQIGQFLGKIVTIQKVTVKGQFERVVSAYFNLEKIKFEHYGYFDLDFSNTFQYSESIKDIFNQLSETKIQPYNIILNLSLNKLEDDFIYPIVEYLQNNSQQISELDFNFSNNPITQETCDVLGSSLSKISSLYKLSIDVRNTDIGYKCIETIAEMKKNIPAISQIVFKINDLTSSEQENAKMLFSKCECVSFIFV